MSIHEQPIGIVDSPSQVVMDDAKAGVSRDEEGNVVRVAGSTYGDFYVDPQQSYDPRHHVEEPEEEPYRVPPADADRMMEIWYLYRTSGNLVTGKMIEALGGAVGPNEALAATLYVEDSPGFNREIVLYAQRHRGEPELWSRWFGNWPDNRKLAEVIYETFRAALAQRLVVEPFRILITPIFHPDHLEYADMANIVNLETRNRNWKERLRESKKTA